MQTLSQMNRLVKFILFVLLPASMYGQQTKTDSLVNLYHKAEIVEKKLILAEQLISIYKNTDRKKAIYYCEEAIKLSKKSNQIKLLAKLYLQIGRLWEKEDFYLIAIKHYDQALTINEKKGDQCQLAFTYYRISNAERKLCEYQNALENCYKSLKISEDLNDEKLLIMNYICLGNIYNRVEENEKAINYFGNVIDLGIRLKDTIAIAAAYNNIGVAYEIQSQYKLAEEYYLKALAMRDPITRYRANVLNNLANIYIITKNFSRAKKYQDEAFKIRYVINDKSGLVSSYCTLGEYYKAIDSLDLAKEKLFVALDKAIDIDSKRMIKEIYFLLQEIFDKEKNYKEAYKYHRKYKEIYDDIYNIEKSKQIAYQELQYKNKKIKEQEKIARYKRNIKIVSGFIVIIIFIIFRLYRHKNHLEKEKLEKKVLKLQKDQIEINLEVKNKELTSLVLTQAGLNEIIGNVKQELTIIKFNLKKENQKALQPVIDTLDMNIKPDIWKEFELRFIEVHKDFYSKLLELCPNLTSNEQRLCALLKLKMTTKEISLITNQSIHSIETARYRLRKKLGLVNENESIVNFIAKI